MEPVTLATKRLHSNEQWAAAMLEYGRDPAIQAISNWLQEDFERSFAFADIPVIVEGTPDGNERKAD